MLRIGALAAILGTLIYAAMSALHGNPPIEDAALILEHVAERPWWRAAHLANIFAVLLWPFALSALTGSLGREDAQALGRISQAMMTCTSAVFAVYFSFHGFGFTALADRWVDVAASGREALLVETNAGSPRPPWPRWTLSPASPTRKKARSAATDRDGRSQPSSAYGPTREGPAWRAPVPSSPSSPASGN